MATPNLLLHPARPWTAELAVRVAANGFPIFPIPPGRKGTFWPGHTKFGSRRPTPEQLARWTERYGEYGLAIACGAFVVAVDIDELDPGKASALENLTAGILGGGFLARVGQHPKRLLLYRVSPGQQIRTRRVGAVEILGEGRYFVGFNTHPKTGAPYEWIGQSPETFSWAELKAVTADDIDALVVALADAQAPAAAPRVVAGPSHDGSPRGTRIGRVPSDPRLIVDEQGRVTDGRDAYLATRVFKASLSGPADPRAIADAAWAEFQATADLSRPRRDGSRPWSLTDAVSKARALLATGKSRPARRVGRSSGSGFWTPPTRQAFRRAVDAAGALGQLSPSAVAVSNTMLGHVEGDGAAFVSVSNLAGALGLSIDAVKKARRTLVSEGFWSRSANQGGRRCLALYTPEPAVLGRTDPLVERLHAGARRRPQTVDRLSTGITREEGGRNREAAKVNKNLPTQKILVHEGSESKRPPEVPQTSASGNASAQSEVPRSRIGREWSS